MHSQDKEPRDYSYDELAEYFHLPINEVSQELGICATLLKKICRKNGINRWPHRKIKSLDKMIDAFELLLQTDPEDFDIISNDIVDLKEKREFLLKNPNVSYNSVLPKHCVNAYNARIQKTGHLLNNHSKSPLADSLKPTKTIHKACYVRYPRRSTRNVGKDISFHETESSEEDFEPDEGFDTPMEEENAACLLLELHQNIPEVKTQQTQQTKQENPENKIEFEQKRPVLLPTKLRWKMAQRETPFVSEGMESVTNFLRNSTGALPCS